MADYNLDRYAIQLGGEDYQQRRSVICDNCDITQLLLDVPEITVLDDLEDMYPDFE